MKKLKVHLENCYGIKKLVKDFNFDEECGTVIIYSPNGVMKSSFAKTFDDISKNSKPCDQMDDSAIPVFDIVADGTGVQITPEEICVIHPYNEKAFDSEGDILKLLADDELKKKYLSIYQELEIAKQSLIKSLRGISESTNCEEELLGTFLFDNIFEVFINIFPDVKALTETFSFGKYNDIFDPDEKVKAFLEKNKDLVEQYFNKYQDLISESDFFRKDGESIFGTTEAKNIGKAIKGNEFFIAGHKLNLKTYGEIDDNEKFTEILNGEINKIYNDTSLKEIYEKIDKQLDVNTALRNFKKVIEKHPDVLLRLRNYEGFKKEVWFSYLKQLEVELEGLVELYEKKKPELIDIIEKANHQQSKWQDAINEFENRFVNMPFTLSIDNPSDAILKMASPKVTFKFKDKPIDRAKLVRDVLSQGEKRAFYLLNVIFNIKSRELNNQKTLIVVDDIADSFDYKNKYAIVEYLNDLANNDNFYLIILTHNFDFYRTLGKRLGISRKNKLHAFKEDDEIKIIEEYYQNQPFLTWRKEMSDKPDSKKYILALIPFVRNLIEYSGKSTKLGSEEGDFEFLTLLLHFKDGTQDITFGELKPIYKEYLGCDTFDSSINDDDSVYEAILEESDQIGNEDFNLENKIILSIAIRLKAEEYMFSAISDNSIPERHQTREFFDRYKRDFSRDSAYKEKIAILENVNIMTPENIHINSFMYEPILDMGIGELKKLYKDVSEL